MPRSKATKLEPQSHSSDERGRAESRQSFLTEKREDYYEFSKSKQTIHQFTTLSFFLPLNLLLGPLRLLEKPSLKPLCACYYWTSLMSSALFF